METVESAIEKGQKAVNPYTAPVGRGLKDVEDIVDMVLGRLGVLDPQKVSEDQKSQEAEYQAGGPYSEYEPQLRALGTALGVAPLYIFKALRIAGLIKKGADIVKGVDKSTEEAARKTLRDKVAPPVPPSDYTTGGGF